MVIMNEEKIGNISVDTSKYKKVIKIALVVLSAFIIVGSTIYIVKKQKK